MNLATYRSELPHLTNGYVNLNHAGVSAVSSRVIQSISKGIEALGSGEPVAFQTAFANFQRCRVQLAETMGVEPVNVALTKNTGHAISIVADGYKWRPGDEVIFADCEYPANTYSWFAQQDRGVICKIVKTNPDGVIPIEAYEKEITGRTKMIAVSWVQFSTGYRSNLSALVDLAHKSGARILVDLIQGLGALPINLTDIGVDFAATGSQKWLIGPMGVGGLYVKPDALDDLRLVNMGAGSVNNVMAFDPLGFDPKPNAQRYDEGTPNFIGAIGLSSALSMLQEAGATDIEESIKGITTYAMERLDFAGYNVLSPRAWDQRAGIVLFRHPTIPNEIVMDSLKAAKIEVVARGGKVRFAPHFYNTPDDIDRAIDALPKA